MWQDPIDKSPAAVYAGQLDHGRHLDSHAFFVPDASSFWNLAYSMDFFEIVVIQVGGRTEKRVRP